MRPDEIKDRLNVSHETMERLELYHALLKKWQRAINLVSPATINDAWTRHFLDSMQVAQFLPDQEGRLVDLGSGAGFPGLVLAIMRPDIDVTLIESDERKAQFLRTVSRETGASARVLSERVEDVRDDLRPDIVTARALAPLERLLDLSKPWWEQNAKLRMIFLKGQNVDEEVKEAQKMYSFTCRSQGSLTEKAAQILFINNVSALS